MGEKITSFDEIDSLLSQVREVVDRDMKKVSVNVEEFNARFMEIFKDYKRISDSAIADFRDGLAEFSAEGNPLWGAVKLISAAGKGIYAWWKKNRFLQKFMQQKEEIKVLRAEILRQRLDNIRNVKEDGIPFVRKNTWKIVEMVGSYDLSSTREDIKKMAIDRAEESLLILVKTYYLEGAVAFLESAYEDVKAGKVVAGNPDVWIERINSGRKELLGRISSFGFPSNSAIYEAIRTNAFFS